MKVIITKELLEKNIVGCFSISELCRKIGLAPVGANIGRIRDKLDQFGIDRSFIVGQGWNIKGHPNYGGKAEPIENILVENSSYKGSGLRDRLINLGIKENKCECCGITEWQGKPIRIQLHHINGIHNDNRLENLMMLCPNCHSQTHNFCHWNK